MQQPSAIRASRHLSACLLAAILLLAFPFSACNHLEIDDDTTEEPQSGNTDDKPTSPEETANEVDNPAGVADIISGKYFESYVWVEGYMAGYATGSSLSSAVFGLAPETPNTNFLLSDSPFPQDYSEVIPVELPKGEFRDELNFCDNPDLMGCKIKVLALVTTYFRVYGLKKPYQYDFPADEGGNGPTDEPHSIILRQEATVLNGR